MDKLLSKHVFLKGMKILSVLPQGKNPVDLNDDFTIEAWYGALNDLADDQFQKAVIYVLRNSKWHPAPVDIRAAAGFSAEAESGSVNLAETQWEEFRAKIGTIGYAGMAETWASGKSVFTDPVTDAVARGIARDFGMSNVAEAGNWRARFLNSYANMKEHGIKTQEMQAIGGLLGLESRKLELVK